MPTSMRTIMDEPLAGCLPLIRYASNGFNLYDSLLLRLRLFLEKEKTEKMDLQLKAEAEKVKIFYWEYLINEVQYERRRCAKGFDLKKEEKILNQWIKKLLRKHPEDLIWDFMRELKMNRDSRNR